jgi:hypothetical protein
MGRRALRISIWKILKALLLNSMMSLSITTMLLSTCYQELVQEQK